MNEMTLFQMTLRHLFYIQFIIRITFLEKPTINEEFAIMMRMYLLDNQDRRNLRNTGIKCDNILYYNNGLCSYNYNIHKIKINDIVCCGKSCDYE